MEITIENDIVRNHIIPNSTGNYCNKWQTMVQCGYVFPEKKWKSTASLSMCKHKHKKRNITREKWSIEK